MIVLQSDSEKCVAVLAKSAATVKMSRSKMKSEFATNSSPEKRMRRSKKDVNSSFVTTIIFVSMIFDFGGKQAEKE